MNRKHVSIERMLILILAAPRGLNRPAAVKNRDEHGRAFTEAILGRRMWWRADALEFRNGNQTHSSSDFPVFGRDWEGDEIHNPIVGARMSLPTNLSGRSLS